MITCCNGCAEQWKQEFKISNCMLEHSPPEDLVRSQWQSRSRNVIYLLYRWIVAIFFVSAVIVSVSTFSFSGGKYFIYLTNWGILMCMATSVFGAVLVTRWHYHKQFFMKINQTNEMPMVFKVYWGLHNTTLTISVIISLIYWTILHRSGFMPLNAANILTHACNSIVMFLDVLIVAYPIRLYHVVQPIGFGMIYCIFSIIYFFAGGTDIFGHTFIYNVLDWNNPGLAIGTVFGTIVLGIVVHTILYWIYQLRSFIFMKWFAGQIITPTTTTTTNVPPSNASISMVIGSYQNKGFTTSNEKLQII